MLQEVCPLLVYHENSQGASAFSLDSSHRDDFSLPPPQNQNQFLATCGSLFLKRHAEGLCFEGPEVKSGACRLGHEEKEEGVQAGVQAAQTRRHFKVHVQTLPSIHEQLHLMEEVQQRSRSEAQQEDGEHQRAGLDVRRPVVVRVVQLADDSGVAHDGDEQRQQEAEDG